VSMWLRDAIRPSASAPVCAHPTGDAGYDEFARFVGILSDIATVGVLPYDRRPHMAAESGWRHVAYLRRSADAGRIEAPDGTISEFCWAYNCRGAAQTRAALGVRCGASASCKSE
jgi:hypothetical protein